ncbi:MAG: hypothetical protein JSU94_21495 [Phycisphaerales bacterium]|nr:MAG: hypothetical protein JSU94_21495 [Phycisphaerales bacterium]
MINISGTLSKAWMAEKLGVEFGRDYYFDPDKRRDIDSRCNDYALRRFPGMRLFYSESNLGQIDYWDKHHIHIGGIQPNLILGMLLGADFVPSEHADADITPAPLAGAGPLDLPAPESLLEHELVGLFDEQIRRVQQDSERRLCPIPPFFWDTSGRATIHGAMTSAQKLFGEAFFMDMLSGPKHALQTMHWIGRAYVLLCRHFSKIARIPITAVHVGECSACMVGPELIRDFVVPVTSQIGRDLGPVRLHSCGPSTNHLAAFAEIENLHSLDLGPDTSISKARELFGKEMLISVAPAPQDMSADSPDPILRWAAQVLEQNAGGNLEFVYHLEPGYNLDAIRALTDFVKNPPPLRNP